jgi:uncharacterized protein YecE (DUF72 family)
MARSKAQPTPSHRLYVGTAAWANPPAERSKRLAGQSHLDYYAATFNSVEINSSFYRSHQHATYARWRESTPARFAFAVKLPRSVTHECALRHYRSPLQRFLDEVSGLERKLHVLLVQLPGSLEFEVRMADRFFKALAGASAARIACEPRHPSWFTPSAETILQRHDIARVAADPARVPNAHLPGGSRKLIYYRLHGSPRMYYSAYSDDYLAQISRAMLETGFRTREVWCVFDNTARYEAWPNAQRLSEMLSVPAPSSP